MMRGKNRLLNALFIIIITSSLIPQYIPAMIDEATIVIPEGPSPMNIATISAGFEKGDFLVREEQGNRVYFDFFEEAFNYISNKGYARMSRDDEKHWVDLMNVIHDSVKGGMKYNTGTLLMVLSRPVNPDALPVTDKKEAVKTKTPSKDGKVMNP